MLSPEQFENLNRRFVRTNKDGVSETREANINQAATAKVQAMSASGKPSNIKETARRLLILLGNQKSKLIWALILTCLSTVCSLAGAYMLRPIMNTHLVYDPFNPASESFDANFAFMMDIIKLGVLYILSFIFELIRQIMMIHLSQSFLKDLRQKMFRKILMAPASFYDTHSKGDVLSCFSNHAESVCELFNSSICALLSSALTIGGTIILMLIVNPLLGLFSSISTIGLYFISRSIVSKGKKAFSKQRDDLSFLSAYTYEKTSEKVLMTLFHQEEICKEEFQAVNDQLFQSEVEANYQERTMGSVTHQLSNLLYVAAAFIGVLQVVNSGFDIGGLTVSLNFMAQLNKPINSVNNQYKIVMSALAGAEKVFSLLDEDEEAQTQNPVYPNGTDANGKPLPLKGHIVFEHVSFEYTEGNPVLKDISFEVKPGEKIAFVGSTGAGKSTVVSLLPRFLEFLQGKITIDGVDIRSMDRSYLRNNIALVLQNSMLFSSTIRENIRLGDNSGSYDQETMEKAAKAASADSFINSLERTYDTPVQKNGINFSQGQRQLISIARTAMSKAPILILDEATSSVDTLTEKNIEIGMENLTKDRTTLIIAHRLSTVRTADCIFVMERGEIIERGTHEELLSQGGTYARLCEELRTDFDIPAAEQ